MGTDERYLSSNEGRRMEMVEIKGNEQLTEYEFYTDKVGNLYLLDFDLNESDDVEEKVLFRNQDGIFIKLSHKSFTEQLNLSDPSLPTKSGLLGAYYQSLAGGKAPRVHHVTNVRGITKGMEYDNPTYYSIGRQSEHVDDDYCSHNHSYDFFQDFLPAEGLGWDKFDFDSGDYNPDDDKTWY